MQHMEKASLYNVDSNRPATAKQLYAVANHFGRLHASTPSGAFRLSKVFAAVLLKFNAEHSETPITHGDITRFFELDAVPQKFLERISVRAPKASTKPKATKAEKTSTKSSEKVIIARKASTKPKAEKTTTQPKVVKASTQSVEDFKARLEAIDARFNKVEAAVESHDKRLASMDAKLDILMAWLETNPEL